MSYTLKIKLNKNLDENIQNYYNNFTTHHSGDSGIDLISPEDVIVNSLTVGTIDYNIQCEMVNSNGVSVSYYLYPRSSISKTDLMMANSVGIIDAGYRGNIMAKVRNMNLTNATKINKSDKLFQICSPDLKPIKLVIVENLNETTRGAGGFGSTN